MTSAIVEALQRLTVGSRSRVISPATAAAVDTGGAYQADDALTQVLRLADVVDEPGGSGRIVKSQILDTLNSNSALVIEAFVFKAAPTGAAAANAPFTFSDADMASCVGRILFTNNAAVGASGSITSRHYQSTDPLPFRCAAGSRDLWVQPVLRSGTPTFGAADQITPVFQVEQD